MSAAIKNAVLFACGFFMCAGLICSGALPSPDGGVTAGVAVIIFSMLLAFLAVRQ